MSKGRNLVLLFAVTVAGILGVAATNNKDVEKDENTVDISEIKQNAYEQGFEDGRSSVSKGVEVRKVFDYKKLEKVLGDEVDHLRTYSKYKPGKNIQYTGGFSYGGVEWTFKENVDQCGEDHGREIDGCADVEEKTVKLESGQASFIKRDCDHEMLHLYFPEYEHGEKNFDGKDSIYYVSNYADFPICNEVISKAQRLGTGDQIVG